MSKLHSIRARIRRISRYARLFKFSHLSYRIGGGNWGENAWERENSLSANAATRTDREGLRDLFVVGCEVLVAQPALGGEDVAIRKVEMAAMGCMGAELDVGLNRKSQPTLNMGFDKLTPPGTHSPAIWAPCRGVRRGRPSGKGGYILSPSETMAAR